MDVSATIGRKVDALRAHASQIHDPDALAARIAEWAAGDGARIGVTAAEAFRLSIIDDDEDEAPIPA
jgi:LmbE family N-acetylglucosaminyl deacetylase